MSGPSPMFGFTGEQQDFNNNLVYLRARYYNPALGRFLTPDSLIPDVTNGQSLNAYAYVYNDPMRYIDPTGHELPELPEVTWTQATDVGDGWWRFTFHHEVLGDISIVIHESHPDFTTLGLLVAALNQNLEDLATAQENKKDAKESGVVGLLVAILSAVVAIIGAFGGPVGWVVTAASIIVAIIGVYVAFYYGLKAYISSKAAIDAAVIDAWNVIYGIHGGETPLPGLYALARDIRAFSCNNPSTCRVEP